MEKDNNGWGCLGCSGVVIIMLLGMIFSHAVNDGKTADTSRKAFTVPVSHLTVGTISGEEELLSNLGRQVNDAPVGSFIGVVKGSGFAESGKLLLLADGLIGSRLVSVTYAYAVEDGVVKGSYRPLQPVHCTL